MRGKLLAVGGAIAVLAQSLIVSSFSNYSASIKFDFNVTADVQETSYKTIINGLQQLNKTTDSYIDWFFRGKNINGNGKENPKPIGSHIDSAGKNWAPKVQVQLAELLGIDVSVLNTKYWVIIKITATQFDCYYVDEDITKHIVGDYIKTYKYDSSLNEFSCSTALVQYRVTENKWFKVIDINSYDSANRIVL